jgi:hypothetical protein
MLAWMAPIRGMVGMNFGALVYRKSPYGDIGEQ